LFDGQPLPLRYIQPLEVVGDFREARGVRAVGADLRQLVGQTVNLIGFKV
jgi:hypothetical protein